MNLKRVVSCVAFTLIAATPAFEALGQEVIFLARHVDPQKLLRVDAPIRDDTPLSETGREQAQILAERLKDAGIDAIYTSDTARTIQTAEPLAALLGLSINQMARRDTDGLLQRLREKHQDDRVLIVGHFNTLPDILEKLGHTEEVKIDMPVWTDLFVVVPRPEGPPTVVYIHY